MYEIETMFKSEDHQRRGYKQMTFVCKIRKIKLFFIENKILQNVNEMSMLTINTIFLTTATDIDNFVGIDFITF